MPMSALQTMYVCSYKHKCHIIVHDLSGLFYMYYDLGAKVSALADLDARRFASSVNIHQ